MQHATSTSSSAKPARQDIEDQEGSAIVCSKNNSLQNCKSSHEWYEPLLARKCAAFVAALHFEAFNLGLFAALAIGMRKKLI